MLGLELIYVDNKIGPGRTLNSRKVPLVSKLPRVMYSGYVGEDWQCYEDDAVYNHQWTGKYSYRFTLLSKVDWHYQK